MKRVFFLLVSALILFKSLGIYAFADEITVTDENGNITFNAEDLIPEGVKDVLDKAEIDVNNINSAKNVLGFVLNSIKSLCKKSFFVPVPVFL